MFSWLWGRKTDGEVKEVGELQEVKKSLQKDIESLKEEKQQLEGEVARLKIERDGMHK